MCLCVVRLRTGFRHFVDDIQYSTERLVRFVAAFPGILFHLQIDDTVFQHGRIDVSHDTTHIRGGTGGTIRTASVSKSYVASLRSVFTWLDRKHLQHSVRLKKLYFIFEKPTTNIQRIRISSFLIIDVRVANLCHLKNQISAVHGPGSL